MLKLLVRYKSLVDWLALVALVAVVLIAFSRDWGSVFPHADRGGDIVSDFALAYIAAWVFQYIVVAVPDLRERRQVFRTSRMWLEQIAEIHERMLDQLSIATDVHKPEANADASRRREVYVVMFTRALTVPPQVVYRDETGTAAPPTWRQFFEREWSRGLDAFSISQGVMIEHLPIELHNAAAAVFRRADFIEGIRYAYWERDKDSERIAAAFDTLCDYCDALNKEIENAAVGLRLT